MYSAFDAETQVGGDEPETKNPCSNDTCCIWQFQFNPPLNWRSW